MTAPGIYLRFEVWQYYEDEAPEHFGYVDLTSIPAVGDVVQLKWLDGSNAHKVVVDRRDFMRLDVHADGGAA